MKLRILGAAFDDLDRGRMFYESQGEGLGSYFLDSVFSDTQTSTLWCCTAGATDRCLDITSY